MSATISGAQSPFSPLSNTSGTFYAATSYPATASNTMANSYALTAFPPVATTDWHDVKKQKPEGPLEWLHRRVQEMLWQPEPA